MTLTPEERWRNAKVFADALRATNTMFSTAIRAIKTAEQAHGPDAEQTRRIVVQVSQFLLDVSPSIKALFFFAAESMYSEQLAEAKKLDTKSLLGIFKPSEVCAVLAVAYYYRRIQKLCPEGEWKKITAKIVTHARITYLVGDTVDHVGSGNGMLLGALRFFALGLFAAKDAKGFQDYNRKLNKDSKVFDMEFEEKRWGCNHLELASILAQHLGFGVNVGYGLSLAYSKSSDLPSEFQEIVTCWRFCMDWAVAFQETGEAPKLAEDDPMYLPESEMDELTAMVSKALDRPFLWMSRTKGDLTREQCVRLGLDPAISTEEDPELGDDQADAPTS